MFVLLYGSGSTVIEIVLHHKTKAFMGVHKTVLSLGMEIIAHSGVAYVKLHFLTHEQINITAILFIIKPIVSYLSGHLWCPEEIFLKLINFFNRKRVQSLLRLCLFTDKKTTCKISTNLFSTCPPL